jgi:anti-sigma factor RsiW
MERCPNCRARVQEGSECRRCGMDLGLLLVTEQAADRLLRRALQGLLAGDRTAAREALRRLRALRRDPLGERLLGYLEQGSPGMGDLPA